MNIKRKVAALIMIGSLAIAASNAAAQEALVGTWVLKVTNITFGVTFEDYRTYHAEGIMMTGVNSLQRQHSDSPGVGVWARRGNGYADTFIISVTDSNGNFAGNARIHSLVTLIGQDSLSITWQSDFISPTGTVVPNSVSGTAKGSRFRLQTVTAVNESFHDAPASFELLQNYPNPFNPSTTIRFEVAKTSYVNLKVLDALGREVRTLADRHYAPGAYFHVWDGKDNNHLPAPSGTYFLRMNAGGYVDTKKMTLIK